MDVQNQVEAFDEGDSHLINQLIVDGMNVNDIAEKFESTAFDISYSFLDIEFSMKRSLFNQRLRNGSLVIGESSVDKRCPSCSTHYPLTNEFWYKHNTSNDGAWFSCMACEKERAEIKRNKNKGK